MTTQTFDWGGKGRGDAVVAAVATVLCACVCASVWPVSVDGQFVDPPVPDKRQILFNSYMSLPFLEDSLVRYTTSGSGADSVNATILVNIVPPPPLADYLMWLEAPTGPDILLTSTVVEIPDRLAVLFEELEDELAELGNDIYPVLDSLIFAPDGSARGIPVVMDGSLCYYSKSFFAGAGLTAPSSWTELLALCGTIEGAFSMSCLGAGITSVPTTQFFDYLMLRMYGSVFYDQFVVGNVSFVDDPRVRHVAAALADLAPYFAVTSDPHLVPLPGFVPTYPRLLDFADWAIGRSALMCEFSLVEDFLGILSVNKSDMGAFVFPDYDRHVPDPSPVFTSGEVGYAGVYGLPKNSLSKQVTRGALKHIASLAEQTRMASEMTTNFPVRPSLNGTITPGTRRALLHDTITSTGGLHSRSWGITGSASVSEPWIGVAMGMLFADSPAAALALFDARASELDALRIAATLSQAVPPDMDPLPGTFTSAIEVSLSSRTPGAFIFYTLDGSVPTTTSPVYSGPITLSADGSTVIRAVAFAEGLASSRESAGEYVLNFPPAPPVTDSSNLTLVLAIVIPLVVVGCVAVIAIGYVVYRRKSVTYKLSSDSELVIAPSELLLGSKVGEGSFGTVYAGSWRATRVAVKQMHAKELSSRQLKEFVSEASLLLRLRHPNVVIFMGVTLEPPSIVTEFMSRGSLADVLHRPDLFIDTSMVFKWAHAMASGLHFLDHAGIVHGDFKSLNVLLDANWTAKICDFGLSSVREAEEYPVAAQANGRRARRVTPIDSMPTPRDLEEARRTDVGTLFWAAPELLDGTAKMSTRTDAFALGVVLWELATRNDLYAGENPVAVALDIVDGRRPEVEVVPERLGALTPIMTSLWNGNAAQRMTLDGAVAALEPLYSDDRLVFPLATADPTGDVVCVHMVVSGFSQRVGDVDTVESEVDLLVRFDRAMDSLVSATVGMVVERGLGRMTIVIPTVVVLGRFVGAFLESEWNGVVAVLILDGKLERCVGELGVVELCGPVMEQMHNVWGDVFGRDLVVETGFRDEPRSPVPVLPTWHPADRGLFTSADIASHVARELREVETVALSHMPGIVQVRLANQSVPSRVLRPVEPSGKPEWLLMRSEIAALVAQNNESVRGSFSRVSFAQLPGRGDPVVVKVLLKQDQSVEGLAQLAKEAVFSAEAARAAASVTGGGAVGPVSVCLEQPFVALVFPRVPHGSLQALLGPLLSEAGDGGSTVRHENTSDSEGGLVLTAESGLEILRCTARTLAAVHAKRLHGHGSLKPTNILVQVSFGAVIGAVVTDIGLDSVKCNQGTMTLVPSTAYQSPETLGGMQLAPAGDVFVMGTLLWELAVHQQAFAGNNPVEVASRIMSGERPSLELIRNPRVAHIVETCWDPDPAKRPTMQQLCDLLGTLDVLE